MNKKEKGLKLIKKYTGQELLLIVFSVLINILVFIIPVIMNGIINREIAFSQSVLVAIILFMLTDIVLQVLYNVLQQGTMKRFKKELAVELYQKIFSMEYETILQYGATYLVERADLVVNTISNMYIRFTPVLLAKALILIFTLIYAWKINLTVFFIMLGIIVINIVGFQFLNQRLSDKAIKMNQHIPKERKDIYQIANQVDFIKQNAENQHLDRLLNQHLEKIEELTKEVNVFAGAMSSMLDFFNMFAQNIVLLLFFYLFLTGKTEFNNIFTISVLLSYFMPAIMQIVAINLDLRDLKSVKEFLQLLESNRERDGETVLDKVTKVTVDMDKLYTNDGGILLEDIHIEAYPGDVIGIVGESGSGKTTLAKSILRFWRKNEEGIKLNEIPLKEIDRESLYKRISFYSQNVPIITGSIYENLNFGRKEVERAKYKELSFLKKFQGEAEPFEKEILENGNNLSGGDKQRIALARLYTEPADVLILDEPSSSLDGMTEAEILEPFFENTDKIVFLITHKKENLKYCNKVYEIAEKKLINKV